MQPSMRESRRPVKAKNRRTITEIATAPRSRLKLICSNGTSNGMATDVTPRIPMTLKVFDPRTLPSATSAFLRIDAMTQVTSSGRLVPIAMMVIQLFLIFVHGPLVRRFWIWTQRVQVGLIQFYHSMPHLNLMYIASVWGSYSIGDAPFLVL